MVVKEMLLVGIHGNAAHFAAAGKVSSGHEPTRRLHLSEAP